MNEGEVKKGFRPYKLTVDERRQIVLRALSGEKQADLARLYDVTTGNVSALVKNATLNPEGKVDDVLPLLPEYFGVAEARKVLEQYAPDAGPPSSNAVSNALQRAAEKGKVAVVDRGGQGRAATYRRADDVKEKTA